MSEFKVGDRVQVVSGLHEGRRGKIVVDDESEYSCRYIVRFEPPAPQTGDDSYTWATAADIRRLVKRKRPKDESREELRAVRAELRAKLAEYEQAPTVAWLATQQQRNQSQCVVTTKLDGWDHVELIARPTRKGE